MTKTIDIETFTKKDILTLMKCAICRLEKVQYRIDKDAKIETKLITDLFPKLELILRGLNEQ